jgi:aminoglycoside/choline kinase family phosphotransferase
MPSPAAPPPWLARTWLRRYLELRASHFDPALPAWRQRDAILDRIEAGPAVFVHNDFHPGNIFGTSDPVVIDWAFCGIGVPGNDAGVLAGDSLFDRVVPPEEAGALIDSVWESYAGTLDPALVEEAEFAFFAGNALRYGWSAQWSEQYAAVYRAVATAAATRIPSLS